MTALEDGLSLAERAEEARVSGIAGVQAEALFNARRALGKVLQVDPESLPTEISAEADEYDRWYFRYEVGGYLFLVWRSLGPGFEVRLEVWNGRSGSPPLRSLADVGAALALNPQRYKAQPVVESSFWRKLRSRR